MASDRDESTNLRDQRTRRKAAELDDRVNRVVVGVDREHGQPILKRRPGSRRSATRPERDGSRGSARPDPKDRAASSRRASRR